MIEAQTDGSWNSISSMVGNDAWTGSDCEEQWLCLKKKNAIDNWGGDAAMVIDEKRLQW